MNDRERFLATMNYQPVDHCPWMEMGYWPETLARWHDEGMPADVHYQQFLGIDRRATMPVNLSLCPGFGHEVLEVTEDYEIFRGGDGVVRKQLKRNSQVGSMPQWLRFPMETREDWENDIKPRLNPNSPARYPLYWEDMKRMWAGRDWPLGLRGGSVFGWLRNWMGLEGISQALYDDPEWVQEMMDYVVDHCIATARRAVEEVDIDYILLWEDMAYKAGPMISPRMFRQFMLEPTRRLATFFHDHGIHIIFMDSDGYPEPLVPLWLEAGVTGLYPVERASGMDVVDLRAKYGRQLRLIGGIDKRAMALGPQAIDEELAHVAPVVADGGYMPWCDHFVPPDVSLENYQYYVRRLKEMTIDPMGFKG